MSHQQAHGKYGNKVEVKSLFPVITKNLEESSQASKEGLEAPFSLYWYLLASKMKSAA
jgi:hypothetical protein